MSYRYHVAGVVAMVMNVMGQAIAMVEQLLAAVPYPLIHVIHIQ